nr:hypothetical protein [Tanacetum cinerariifolium]
MWFCYKNQIKQGYKNSGLGVFGFVAEKSVIFMVIKGETKDAFGWAELAPSSVRLVYGSAAARVRLCGLAPQGSVWSVGLSAPLGCVRLCGLAATAGPFGSVTD